MKSLLCTHQYLLIRAENREIEETSEFRRTHHVKIYECRNCKKIKEVIK